MESLKIAVSSGADEVYLGINEFNARNNIDGFNLTTLKIAVDYAHVFGVKVNLAINILFADNELQQAVDTIVDSYNMGVDSFIVQDLGLAGIIRENYPEIELHASTQMGIHNLEGAKWAEEFGFKRIVLARETPLNEIKRIRDNTSLEIEYFAQGALCVSFSGNCYMSSYLCGASGNRGRCKQLCRLPFVIKKNGKALKSGYLLSAKDFMMIDRLDDLKRAGVDVLKIEGRARRPFYVGAVTREYFKALHGKKANQENIMLGFNREYTEGYFNGNGGVISPYNNHIGVKVGKVQKVNIGKKFNEIIFDSNRKLSPKSTFKFFDGTTEKTTLSAYDLKEVQKGKYLLTTTHKVSVGDEVRLIIEQSAEDEMLANVNKKQIQLKLFLNVGEPIRAKVRVMDRWVEVRGEEILEPANNQPLSQEALRLNFKKSDLFDAEILVESLDSVFMPKQRLNEFRRRVFDKVHEEFVKPFEHDFKKIKVQVKNRAKKFDDFQIIEKPSENLNSKNIVYSPEEYVEEEIVALKEKCEKESRKLYLDLPNFALSEDIEFLKRLATKTGVGVVVNNYYALNFGTEKVIGAGLNVYNNATADVLGLPVMSAESEVGSLVDFPYMTLRHCPMKSHLNASCKNCPYCDGYEYIMDNGTRLKLKRKKLSTCTFYLVK